jgi:hypothetical protein
MYLRIALDRSHCVEDLARTLTNGLPEIQRSFEQIFMHKPPSSFQHLSSSEKIAPSIIACFYILISLGAQSLREPEAWVVSCSGTLSVLVPSLTWNQIHFSLFCTKTKFIISTNRQILLLLTSTVAVLFVIYFSSFIQFLPVILSALSLPKNSSRLAVLCKRILLSQSRCFRSAF